MNSSTSKSKLFLFLFLLLILPATVYLARQNQDVRKKAQVPREEPKIQSPPKPEYKEGEVIIKFKIQSAKFKTKTNINKSLDKEAVSFSELDETTIPQSLKTINQKYKIEKIEKVFKGTDSPEEELSKFKQKFSKELVQGKRKINEKELLKIDLSRIYTITFDKKNPVEQVINSLRENPDVEYAEPNYIVTTFQNFTTTPSQTNMRVFGTSTIYSGNLGGLAGADAKCQERASAAGLGGTWKAWLSDSTTSAASRLNQNGGSYRLINGTIIANNWSDLTDGVLQSPINITELGNNNIDNGAWTYTLPNGNMDTGGVFYTCNNWTEGTVNFEGIGGASSETSSYWTKLGPSTCNALQGLYCFDQIPSFTPTSTPTPTLRPNQPNDPYYPQMWNLSKIKMEDAWKITKGSKDVAVAVIDTGIDYTHEELGKTIVSERSFEQITKDPLSLFFSTGSTRVSQTIAINNNRLAYYSDDKIYIYSFDTATTEVINLPSSAPDPKVIRLALKDNILVYAADYNHTNYYSKAQIYLYDLTTHEHRQISDFTNSWVYPFEIGDGKVVWTVGAHVQIYDIQTGVRSLQTNVNTYPFQYISYLKASGNRVAYSLHSEESPCYQTIVIHNTDTNQRQRYYPPNIGPVMDFKDNKILYRACYGDGAYNRLAFYLFDITTGQAQELSYSLENGAIGGETKTAAFITWVFSMTDENFFGDGVVFLSENISGNGIIAYDQISNKYIKISLVKAAYNFTSEGKRVCFVSSDSRIYCHTYDTNYDYPQPPQNYFNNKVVGGYNFVENNNNPIDRFGHGTHVAGTIGATVNNGIGISGINWDVSLMAIKVLNDTGSGTTNNVVRGIKYAVDNGAKVINMSLGGSYPCSQSQTYQDAIFYANAGNVSVVVSAGNGNTDASNFSPASCQGVIAVAATGPTDERTNYSNYGSVVDLAAPGGDRLKCTDDITCLINSTYPDNQYRFFQGTSMAAPHVAGLIALMLAFKPVLVPSEIETMLKENGDNLTTDQPIGKLINAYKVLFYINHINPTPTLTPTPTISPKALYFNSQNSFNYVETINPKGFNFNGDFSVELWIKPENLTRNVLFYPIAYLGPKDAYQMRSFNLNINQWSSNTFRLAFVIQQQDGTYVNIGYIIPSELIINPDWFHIGITSKDKILQLFINGTLQDSRSYQTIKANQNQSFILGSFNSDDRFFGAIDELRISNVAREIKNDWLKSIYEKPLSVDLNTLALWSFENNLTDRSNNGNDGLVTGIIGYTNGRVSLSSPTPTPQLTTTPIPTPTPTNSPPKFTMIITKPLSPKLGENTYIVAQAYDPDFNDKMTGKLTITISTKGIVPLPFNFGSKGKGNWEAVATYKPQTVGKYDFNIEMSDSAGNKVTTKSSFTVVASNSPTPTTTSFTGIPPTPRPTSTRVFNNPPKITTDYLSNARLRRWYFSSVSATDQEKDKTTIKIANLPVGVRQTYCATSPGSTTCYIFGIPLKSGLFYIKVTATDSKGMSKEKILKLNVY